MDEFRFPVDATAMAEAALADPERAVATIAQMLADRDRALEDYLAVIATMLDDHEARITALEP